MHVLAILAFVAAVGLQLAFSVTADSPGSSEDLSKRTLFHHHGHWLPHIDIGLWGHGHGGHGGGCGKWRRTLFLGHHGRCHCGGHGGHDEGWGGKSHQKGFGGKHHGHIGHHFLTDSQGNMPDAPLQTKPNAHVADTTSAPNPTTQNLASNEAGSPSKRTLFHHWGQGGCPCDCS